MIRKRGLALPMVVAVTLVMCLVFFGLWKMMRGVGTQLEYSDAHVRALAIAESGYHLLVTRLLAKPWEERWFAAGPDAQPGLEMDGGTWDYFIQTTPGQTETADIWIRASYKNSRRLHFYRFKYEDQLFRSLTNPAPAFTGSLEDSGTSPLTPTAITPFTEHMNTLISRREQNRANMNLKWQELSKNLRPKEILAQLGAYVGDDLPENGFSRKPGVDTTAPTVPDKLPVKAQAFLDKMEPPETLVAWFRDSLLLPPAYVSETVMPLIEQIQETINRLFRKEKYRVAEKIYRDFLNFVFSVKVGIDLAELEKELTFYRELAQVAMDYSGKDLDRQYDLLKEKYGK